MLSLSLKVGTLTIHFWHTLVHKMRAFGGIEKTFPLGRANHLCALLTSCSVACLAQRISPTRPAGLVRCVGSGSLSHTFRGPYVEKISACLDRACLLGHYPIGFRGQRSFRPPDIRRVIEVCAVAERNCLREFGLPVLGFRARW